MAISFKHAFTSPKADGVDSTLVQPSNWNAEHTLTLAAGKVLGRNTSSAGAAQELPLAFDTAGNAALSATGSFTTAVGTTAERPGTPVTGMFRFNSSLVKFEGYNGSTWSPVGGGGATIGDTAPGSPSAGDLWWNSANGQMYTFYNDGTSSQWVVANSFTGGSAYLPLTGGTLTGAVSFSSGSAAAPAITTAGDTNTGVFYPAADTVAVSTGGVARFTVGNAGIVSRVYSAASDTSISVDPSLYDQYVWTALAGTLTFNASTTGSPADGTRLIFRIKDNGTTRTLTWTTSGAGSYRAIGVTLPTATTANKVIYVGCIYNSNESFWDVVAVQQQA